MSTYILDIETKPKVEHLDLFLGNVKLGNVKDPDKIKAKLEDAKSKARKGMSVSTHFSEIACIGIKVLDGQAQILDLQQFSDLLLSDDCNFITFNGKKFDFPVLINNLIMGKYHTNYDRLRTAMKRWSSEVHIDLMEVFCPNDFLSLDTLAQIYLGIEKTPIDFEACTQEQLEQHCLEDLEITEKLFNKFEAVATFNN